MAAPTTYNFPNHIQGSTFKGVSFEVKLNGSPLDLTGAIIEMEVDLAYPKIASLKLSTLEGNQKILISAPPTDGKFLVKSQVINLPQGVYDYDIKITTIDGNVRKPIKGKWTIVSSATYD